MFTIQTNIALVLFAFFSTKQKFTVFFPPFSEEKITFVLLAFAFQEQSNAHVFLFCFWMLVAVIYDTCISWLICNHIYKYVIYGLCFWMLAARILCVWSHATHSRSHVFIHVYCGYILTMIYMYLYPYVLWLHINHNIHVSLSICIVVTY